MRHEAVLSSLSVDTEDELQVMLTDMVQDCIQCTSTNIVRCPATGKINGVCLASKAALFDQQMDRLCEYAFKNERLTTAIEFLKYVFNRLDVEYHFEQHKVTKPIFVALVSVRKECWNQGIGNAMLQSCIMAAKEDRCDGAVALASNSRACQLINSLFPTTLQSIKYDTFRGQHKTPPIVPDKNEPQRALYVMLSRF